MPPAMTVAELAAKREKVINIISSTMKDHIIPIVKRFVKDPRQLWAELKESFETTSLDKQLVLRGKLDQIKMSEGMLVEEYAHELDHIVSLLANIDLIVEDRELIRIALSGLPKSWAGFTTSMNPIIHKDEKMSFACFISYMQAEELQRAIQEMKRQNGGDSNEEALYVYHDHNSYNNNNNNYNNHNSNNNSNLGKGKGDRFGGRGRGQSSSNSRHSRSCNFCGNQGDWEPECLKKIQGQIKDLQIKDLQIKHSEIKKAKHHINIAKAEVVKT
ncbi:unnamed protein product [Calypogeia fissa]